MLLSRFSTDFSVRTRLIVLSLIPVVGFAAIALAYISSERAVEAAFESVQQSSRLADASRVFKESLTGMQVSAKDFVAQPQPGLISRFSDAHGSAMESLNIIQELADQTDKQTLTALQGRVANLKSTFAALTAEQDELGLTEFEGIQGGLRDGGSLMERIVNEDMSWLSRCRPAQDPHSADADAALRGRVPPDAHRARQQLVQAGAGRVREGVRRHRRGRHHEAAAQRSGESLHRRLRQLDRQHCQDFPFDRDHLGRDAPDAARCRRDHRVGRPQGDRRRRRRRGIAGSNQVADLRHRHRRGRARARLQLADRARHHGAARAPLGRDGAARGRRQHGRHPGDRGEGRDRRHGAHRDRVPRQRGRARAARRHAAEIRARARAPFRNDRRDDRALRKHRGSGAREGARRRRTA